MAGTSSESNGNTSTTLLPAPDTTGSTDDGGDKVPKEQDKPKGQKNGKDRENASFPVISIETVDQTLTGIKSNLETLTPAVRSLGHQAIKTVRDEETTGIEEASKEIQQQMEDQEKKQLAQIDQIKKLLEDTLKDEVEKQLRELIEAGVMEQIDDLVKERVAEELRARFPDNLKQEVDEKRQELKELQLNLQNSESRRANSLLRSNRPNDPVQPIFKSNGAFSKLFPKDVKSLFNMDGSTVQKLLIEYFQEFSESREKNLNTFMQFCGVPYRLVRH